MTGASIRADSAQSNTSSHKASAKKSTAKSATTTFIPSSETSAAYPTAGADKDQEIGRSDVNMENGREAFARASEPASWDEVLAEVRALEAVRAAWLADQKSYDPQYEAQVTAVDSAFIAGFKKLTAIPSPNPSALADKMELAVVVHREFEFPEELISGWVAEAREMDAASGLDLFAAAWLQQWGEAGGSVHIDKDGTGWFGTPEYRFSRAFIQPDPDLPETIQRDQVRFRSDAYHGKMRGMLDFLEMMPCGAEAVKSYMRRRGLQSYYRTEGASA